MKKYIVKGRIKHLVKAGKRGLLRSGSYQFLPNTEVILTDNNLAYNPRIQNRFWVRGKSKSGLLTSKATYFKYLFDLKIEEVNSPNAKTLNFIKNNNLLFFEAQQIPKIKDWLDYFEEISIAEKLTGEITDEVFKKAQQFVQLLQMHIKREQKSELINRYLKFPIKIRHFKSLKKDDLFDKQLFNIEIKDYFLNEVCESILQTDVSTIFPSDKKMLIGKVEIAFNEKNNFKITKIIYTKHGESYCKK